MKGIHHLKLITDPNSQLKFNIFFTWFWLCNMLGATALLILSPGLWAKVSIFYLVQVSLWANLATHFGAISASEGAVQTQTRVS